jgi:hypothetical protein
MIDINRHWQATPDVGNIFAHRLIDIVGGPEKVRFGSGSSYLMEFAELGVLASFSASVPTNGRCHYGLYAMVIDPSIQRKLEELLQEAAPA